MNKIIGSNPYSNFNIERVIANRVYSKTKENHSIYDKFTDPHIISNDELIEPKYKAPTFSKNKYFNSDSSIYHNNIDPSFMDKKTETPIRSFNTDKLNKMYSFNINAELPYTKKIDYKDFYKKHYGIPSIKFDFDTSAQDKIAGVLGMTYEEKVVKKWQENESTNPSPSLTPSTTVVTSPPSTNASPTAESKSNDSPRRPDGKGVSIVTPQQAKVNRASILLQSRTSDVQSDEKHSGSQSDEKQSFHSRETRPFDSPPKAESKKKQYTHDKSSVVTLEEQKVAFEKEVKGNMFTTPKQQSQKASVVTEEKTPDRVNKQSAKSTLEDDIINEMGEVYEDSGESDKEEDKEKDKPTKAKKIDVTSWTDADAEKIINKKKASEPEKKAVLQFLSRSEKFLPEDQRNVINNVLQVKEKEKVDDFLLEEAKIHFRIDVNSKSGTPKKGISEKRSVVNNIYKSVVGIFKSRGRPITAHADEVDEVYDEVEDETVDPKATKKKTAGGKFMRDFGYALGSGQSDPRK